MSEWKLKDIGYIRAVCAGHQLNNECRNLRFVLDGGAIVYVRECDVLRSIPPQSAPVDVSQIKVGDEVTVKAKVIHSHNGNYPFTIETKGGDYSLIAASEIASHTPSRPPSTLAEFDAMTPEQRERWFNEMKGKVTT